MENQIDASALVSEKQLRTAQWRLGIIKPALRFPKGSMERMEAISTLSCRTFRLLDGRQVSVGRQSLYKLIAAYEAGGMEGLLACKIDAKTGRPIYVVTKAWDGFFTGYITDAGKARVADELTGYIRSLLAFGHVCREVRELAAIRLIEISRGLNVPRFYALELGRPGDPPGAPTQFAVCSVPHRIVDAQRAYRLLAKQ